MQKKTIYQQPVYNVVEIHVEQGFAASGTIEGGGEGGSLGSIQAANDELDF